jgi:hypothetical protein
MSKIRNDWENEYIWISVDETTDKQNRYFVKIIVGSLKVENESKRYLPSSSFVPRANAVSINQTLNRALNILRPNGIKYHKVLLLVTDRARYVIKAGKQLKALFPKMIHLTRLVHALHNVLNS